MNHGFHAFISDNINCLPWITKTLVRASTILHKFHIMSPQWNNSKYLQRLRNLNSSDVSIHARNRGTLVINNFVGIISQRDNSHWDEQNRITNSQRIPLWPSSFENPFQSNPEILDTRRSFAAKQSRSFLTTRRNGGESLRGWWRRKGWKRRRCFSFSVNLYGANSHYYGRNFSPWDRRQSSLTRSEKTRSYRIITGSSMKKMDSDAG